MKHITKEIQIAIVAIVGVVVLFFGLQFLKGLNIFGGSNTYYIVFDDINGLSASSPIYADGFKVGTVKDIAFDYNHAERITVEVSLDKDLRLPKGTDAEISSDMLGNIKVNLRMANNPAERINAGDTIMGYKETGMLDKASSMMPSVEKMLPKIDSILTSLNALLANPSIARSLENVDEITANLNNTSSQLNMLVGTMNRKVPAMMAKTDRILDDAGNVAKKLNEIDYVSTLAKVDATLSNVQEMTAKLNSKEGTLGLLMNDNELYENLSAVMRDADSLMIDLKSHPKRYVHFSIFGKKSK
ncbi:MlaD family protein [Xylanibacter muris]|uniref:MCE family protein n=1 Tax=Xylanibacter muris TaxID=2736290 RepID=A0ABX2ARA9_9BACT|nr:MlaD family protein [Xylanibacter muris]NPD93225.1 MCE family protein [Xylanibacter muris]